MTYTTSVDPPESVVVGDQVDLGGEVCCTNPPTCTDETFVLTIAGEPVGEVNIDAVAEFCIDVEPNSFQYSSHPVFDINNKSFTESGIYTVALGPSSATVEVQEPAISSDVVSASCPNPSPASVTVGDTVTLTSTVSNGNDALVSATVEFSFGSATQSKTATIAANGSETVSASFTAEEATEYPNNAVVTEVSQA